MDESDPSCLHCDASLRDHPLTVRLAQFKAVLELIAAPGEKSVRLMEQAARKALGYESQNEVAK